MWQGRELVSVVLAGQLGVRLENCPKPIPWTVSAVPDLGEAVEMSFDLAFVPREQDRLDITEVLVQRGAPNAGVGRDLRHAAAISAACKTLSGTACGRRLGATAHRHRARGVQNRGA